jgi:DNA polymerase-3 subunit delta'
MLRRDVDEAVVAAASHTPFEARYRIFVLERADTLIEQAANALLKTLEEPPAYVVLILLTDRPTQVLPTIASRCQPVRFDALPPDALAQRLKGIPDQTAAACARLSLGDGEKAQQLAFGEGPRLRAAAERLARAPLHRRSAQERPWLAVLEQARAESEAAKDEVERALKEELEYLPTKEHKKKRTEYAERARRAERRARTEALDHALQLAGLWYRDLACVAAGAPELAFHADRAQELHEDARGKDPHALITAQELVDDTRARLILNVSEELACEALAYRLEATLS